ncbi:membrane protein [Klebsiella michiganensis]|nr:membrane protein [Klebsiella michiganensis]
MTLQQWLFSIKGRIGRRDFWIWIAIWIMTMSALFTLAGSNLLNLQTAAFILVCLLWPTAAVTIKRLHDRGKSGLWALLMILAWMLLAGKLVDAAWGLAVGRRAVYTDADYRHDADRPGRVCRYPGRE